MSSERTKIVDSFLLKLSVKGYLVLLCKKFSQWLHESDSINMHSYCTDFIIE